MPEINISVHLQLCELAWILDIHSNAKECRLLRLRSCVWIHQLWQYST